MLRAQGSGPYDGDGAAAAYETDPRLQELDDMERELAEGSDGAHDGASPPHDGLSVHTWPPRGCLSLESSRDLNDLSRAVHSGRLAGPESRL